MPRPLGEWLRLLYGPLPLDCKSWGVGVASLLAGTNRTPPLGTSSQMTETLWQDRLLPHRGPVPTVVLRPFWRSRVFPLVSHNFRAPVTSSPGGILGALLPRFGIRRQPPTPPPEECRNSAWHQPLPDQPHHEIPSQCLSSIPSYSRGRSCSSYFL